MGTFNYPKLNEFIEYWVTAVALVCALLFVAFGRLSSFINLSC